MFQWARYIEAYGPLDWGERIFRRLDAGFAFLQMLIINRSGGVRSSPDPKVKGTPVTMREFMWDPPPEQEPQQETPTLENLWAAFGGGRMKVKKRKEN